MYDFIKSDKDCVLITKTSIHVKNTLIYFDKFQIYIDNKIRDKLKILEINLTNCYITDDINKNTFLPKNFFVQFANIESIILDYNMFTEPSFIVPKKVTYLSMSYTNADFSKLDVNHVEFFNREQKTDYLIANVVHRLYQNQHQLDLVQNIVQNPVQNQEIKNVHDNVIQDSTKKSLDLIISKREKLCENYIDDLIEIYKTKEDKEDKSLMRKFCNIFFNEKLYKFKKLLNMYDSYKIESIVYSYKPYKICTISDILERICFYILLENTESQYNIIENLLIQMEDGIGFCFVGKYTRLMNTLTSFVKDVTIEIPINEKISNKILQLNKIDKPVEDKVKDLEIFLDILEVSENIKNEWINAFKEYN